MTGALLVLLTTINICVLAHVVCVLKDLKMTMKYNVELEKEDDV